MSLAIKRAVWGGAALLLLLSAMHDYRSAGWTFGVALQMVAAVFFSGFAFIAKGG